MKGCLRTDGALRGVGGCPMAQDDLVGNAQLNGLLNGAKIEAVGCDVHVPRSSIVNGRRSVRA